LAAGCLFGPDGRARQAPIRVVRAFIQILMQSDPAGFRLSIGWPSNPSGVKEHLLSVIGCRPALVLHTGRSSCPRTTVASMGAPGRLLEKDASSNVCRDTSTLYYRQRVEECAAGGLSSLPVTVLAAPTRSHDWPPLLGYISDSSADSDLSAQMRRSTRSSAGRARSVPAANRQLKLYRQLVQTLPFRMLFSD
jgi:hypothetical protein